MAQRDFSKNILTLEERNKRDTLIGRLNRLRQQEVINKTRPYDKNRDDILAKQIKDTQLQLGIDPESMATKPSLKNIERGTDFKSKPNPVNSLRQKASLTTNTPSNRTTTKTSSRTNKNSGVKSKSLAGGTPTTSSRAYDPNNMVTPQTGKDDSERRKYEMLTSKEKEAYRLRRAEAEKKAGTRRDEITFPYKDMPISRQKSKRTPSLKETLENNPKFKKVMDNQVIQRFNYSEAGDDSFEDEPQKIDENVNALEKLVSRIVGRNIRFEDIPEDDPFITNMPQNYQNLRRGGQVKRMGHGGAITPEQKKRISRIVQENKARKSKSTKATPTATSSKKRAAPFSDMKKARMNGNKKRTNR